MFFCLKWLHFNQEKRTQERNSECEKAGMEPELAALLGASSSTSINSTPRSTSSLSSKFDELDFQSPGKVRRIDSFVSRTTEAEKSQLDLNVARFFYSCNIPFNAVEADEFSKMVKSLRPSYTPPNRKALAGPLLDKVYLDVKDEMSKDISPAQALTICQDGWSNIHNDPIIAHSLHDGKKAYLLNIEDTGSDQKTANFCYELLDRNIQEVQDTYHKPVFAVCTDNEAKMVAMRKQLTENYPDIVAYGCSAHYMNLLEEKVNNKQVMSQVVHVQKYFRNHHRAHGKLKEKGGNRPIIPGETRWNSQVDCLQSFLNNLPFYMAIRSESAIAGDNIVDTITASKIDNVMIRIEASNLLKVLKKFGVALDKLQSDDCHLSDATHIWFQLAADEELLEYRQAILDKMKVALQPFHILAYITDPKYEDYWKKAITCTDESNAEKWLVDHNRDFLETFLMYRLKDTNVFPSYMFDFDTFKNMSASDWWRVISEKAGRNDKISVGFTKLMVNLHSCPASSASIERWFSTVGFVWSKVRNRLGVEKAQKLSTIYRHLRKSEVCILHSIIQMKSCHCSLSFFPWGQI